MAIRLINKNYIKSGKKIKSIKDLSSGLNPFEIFSRKIAKVNNKLISLDNIEKDLVLPISDNDPRLHFAVICASKGCPVTLNEAYRGEKLEKQLDFVSKSGLNLPRMFQKSGATLKISKIFEWYKKDFTNSKFKSVLGFINYFREENHKGELGSRDITLKEKKSEDQEVLSLKKGKTKVSFNTTNNLLTILERGKVLRWKELRHFRVQCR